MLIATDYARKMSLDMRMIDPTYTATTWTTRPATAPRYSRTTNAISMNSDGSYRNPVKLDGLETSDPKLIGKQLNHIAETARTGGELQHIGNLYGFDLTQTVSMHAEKPITSTHATMETADPRLASLNFIHAHSTIEMVSEDFKKKNEEFSKDIPTLQSVVEGTWRKESELMALRSQMTELERKI